MRYKITLILGLCFLLTFQNIFSQNPIEETIKIQATKMSQALIDGDYGLLIDYTHPNVIKFSGGKEKMLGFLNNQMGKMANQGISFDAVEIGDPLETKLYKGKYQTLLPKTTTMNLNGRRVLSTDYLFGFSDSEGKKWTFVEAAKLKTAAAKKIFPDFETDIEIPDKEAPIEIENTDEPVEIENSDETIYTVEEELENEETYRLQNESGLATGYVLAIISGIVLLLALIVGAIYLALRAKKTKDNATPVETKKPAQKAIKKINCVTCDTENIADSKYCKSCGKTL